MNLIHASPHQAVWSQLSCETAKLAPHALSLLAVTKVAHRIFRRLLYFQLFSRRENWTPLFSGFILQIVLGDSTLGRIGKVAAIIVEIALNFIEARIQIQKIAKAYSHFKNVWNGYVIPIESDHLHATSENFPFNQAMIIHRLSAITFAAWNLIYEAFILQFIIWRTVDLFIHPNEAFLRIFVNLNIRAPALINHPYGQWGIKKARNFLPDEARFSADAITSHLKKKYQTKKGNPATATNFRQLVREPMGNREFIFREISTAFIEVYLPIHAPEFLTVEEECKFRNACAHYRPFPRRRLTTNPMIW